MRAVDLLVEGDLDEAVGLRLLASAGANHGVTFGKQGSGYVLKKVAAFARGVGQGRLLVLVDLMDTGLACPSEVVRRYLPNPVKTVAFRVVAREIESWILADEEGIARFLGVSKSIVPRRPEELPDPKNALLNVAKRSGSSRLRAALLPGVAGGARVGPLYNHLLSRFAIEDWNPARAASNAKSLKRAIEAARTLVRLERHSRLPG